MHKFTPQKSIYISVPKEKIRPIKNIVSIEEQASEEP